MVFIDFQNFVNFRRKLADFWPKNRHFLLTQQKSAKILKKKFRRKINQVHGKCSNWLKNGQKCTLGYFLQLHGGILGYFAFFQFYGSRNAPRRQFWIKFVKIGNYRKIAIFWPKMFQMTSNLAKTCILVFFIDFQNFGIFR